MSVESPELFVGDIVSWERRNLPSGQGTIIEPVHEHAFKVRDATNNVFLFSRADLTKID